MAKSDIWVVPHGACWGLKLELGDSPFAERATQAEAIVSARALAKQSKTALVILDHDGRLQERESYRGVPRPPANFLAGPNAPHAGMTARVSAATARGSQTTEEG